MEKEKENKDFDHEDCEELMGKIVYYPSYPLQGLSINDEEEEEEENV